VLGRELAADAARRAGLPARLIVAVFLRRQARREV
jgi:hypothetical protein